MLDDDERVLFSLRLSGDVLTARTIAGRRMDAMLADLAVELPDAVVRADVRDPVDLDCPPAIYAERL